MNDEIEMLIDENGTKYYVLKNSNLDLSEYVEDDKGTKYYALKKSNLNKSIKEIVNMTDGTQRLDGKFYYKNKLLHNTEEPAIQYINGDKTWYKNGVIHRDNGYATQFDLVSYIDGIKMWYKNGLIHRVDGPAVEAETDYDKYSEYRLNDLLHNINGPAVYYEHKIEKHINKQYWINGKQFTEIMFNIMTKDNQKEKINILDIKVKK